MKVPGRAEPWAEARSVCQGRLRELWATWKDYQGHTVGAGPWVSSNNMLNNLYFILQAVGQLWRCERKGEAKEGSPIKTV